MAESQDDANTKYFASIEGGFVPNSVVPLFF